MACNFKSFIKFINSPGIKCDGESDCGDVILGVVLITAIFTDDVNSVKKYTKSEKNGANICRLDLSTAKGNNAFQEVSMRGNSAVYKSQVNIIGQPSDFLKVKFTKDK